MEYKNILCPLSGSEFSEKALDTATYIAKLSGARLILLHVVEKWYRSEPLVTDSAQWQDIHEQWLDEGRKLLEKYAARLKGEGVAHVETILEEGDAAHEIIARAKERNIDLLVIASHRHTVVGHLFAGSYMDKIINHIHCPVLWVS